MGPPMIAAKTTNFPLFVFNALHTFLRFPLLALKTVAHIAEQKSCKKVLTKGAKNSACFVSTKGDIERAIGAILAYFFLKEQMQWYRWILLLITLLGVYGLSYSPELQITNFWLGVIGALMCAFGWGIEAVILAKSMQDPEVKDEYALQIRQSTSALFYGIVLVTALRGWKFTVSLFVSNTHLVLPIIAAAALCATVSYLFYYKAIATIGASKAMALNVSYAAWAIAFTVLILHDTSVLKPMTLFCR